MGSNTAVGAGFFSGKENWRLLRIRSRCGLRFTKTEHSCLVHLIITPCISCLPYAREPEARPLGWLALKITNFNTYRYMHIHVLYMHVHACTCMYMYVGVYEVDVQMYIHCISVVQVE